MILCTLRIKRISLYTAKTDMRNILGRLRRHHDSNVSRGLYGYMWWNGLKIILVWFAIMVPVILLVKYFIDLDPFIHYITNNLSSTFVLLIFLASESLLGMIPPDIFIIWTGKFHSPLFFLTVLGILSYIGGIISYFIGRWIAQRPKINAYIGKALEKYIILVRKWGGAFIILSAIFPFSPFSMVVIAVSLFKYPFKYYLLFGVSRIVRFIVQGIIYLHILNVDTFFSIIK
jgi:membrane protein YqaA with SNARE-associated domain